MRAARPASPARSRRPPLASDGGAREKPPMLHLNDLTYRLGERLLIDRRTVALPTGARVGLVGRNGAGKTTLFRPDLRRDLARRAERSACRAAPASAAVEQEAPGGDAALIDFVLAADPERAACSRRPNAPTIRCASPKSRRGSPTSTRTPRPRAPRASSPASASTRRRRRGRCRSSPAAGACASRSPRCCSPSPTCCCSTSRPTTSISRARSGWSTISRRYPATVLRHQPRPRSARRRSSTTSCISSAASSRLYSGGYDDFERQRRESAGAAGQGAARSRRSSASICRPSSTASAPRRPRRARRSRASRCWRRMEPIAAIVDETVAALPLAAVAKKLGAADHRDGGGQRRLRRPRRCSRKLEPDASPMTTASACSAPTATANRPSPSCSPDGCAPMAGKLVARQQARRRLFRPASGRRSRPRRHALRRMSRELMPARRRPRSAAASRRSAFPATARTRASLRLSGGEKARLLMGLATFDGPQLLILDEPTNHLDIDSRGELIEAINDYDGAWSSSRTTAICWRPASTGCGWSPTAR